MISVQVGTGLTFADPPKASDPPPTNISRPRPGEKAIHFGDSRAVLIRGKFRFACDWALDGDNEECLSLSGAGCMMSVYADTPAGKRISRWDRRTKRRTFQAFPSQLATIIERHFHDYLNSRENNTIQQHKVRHRARLRAARRARAGA